IYPGDSPKRQPVHTVYGGAHIFKSDTSDMLGKLALQSLEKYAPDAAAFAEAFGLKSHAHEVYEKVLHKLKTEAVEDFRIDFEDGFGNRPDPEEDAAAGQAALEVAKGMSNKTLPPFIGIRIKPFTEDLKERSLQTLDIFLTTLLAETQCRLPQNFIVMLPKVTIPEQIEALVKFFELFEEHFFMPPGTLKLEIMVETTQAIMDENGTNPLRRFVEAGKGRCVACHFGTYDYTAACGITAKYQTMSHPVCDFAHHVTKVALAQTGIWLSDGATNVLPVGIHKGDNLTENQQVENRQAVHRAWRQAFDHVRHSLWNGFYQGWDLHPAQLPARYAAVFSFFLESMEDATLRLRSFVEKSARASLTGDVFDDAATGQGLLNYFLRALNCGAISEAEIQATGLTLEEIRSRSFLKILESRAQS
ncbi:MAG: phosphoenolpyruvate kinase, partial [Bacteroidota bacterium]